LSKAEAVDSSEGVTVKLYKWLPRARFLFLFKMLHLAISRYDGSVQSWQVWTFGSHHVKLLLISHYSCEKCFDVMAFARYFRSFLVQLRADLLGLPTQGGASLGESSLVCYRATGNIRL